MSRLPAAGARQDDLTTTADAGGPSRSRRGLGLAILVITGLVLAAAAAVEVLAEAPAPRAADPVPADPPVSGTWFCPVVAAEEETAVLSVATATAQASTVTVVRYTEQGPQPDEPVELAAGAAHDVVLRDGQAARPVAVRWSGGPAVATWRVEGPDTAGAPCEPGPAPVWHVTGFDTTAQNQGRLHLFNPFAVDAVARVVFGTPTGRLTRVATENILVPAGQTLVVAMNEHEPEQPDLAASVEVLVGRLVVQGESRLRPTANQPGPTGRTLLPAAAPALAAALAYARTGDTAASWLSVYNPGDREAAIELRVSDPLPEAHVLLGEMNVPAGGVVRVDLADTSATVEFGISLVGVNEVPVVATRFTSIRGGQGVEGVAASAGAPPARAWALAGGGGGDRAGRVSLFNPGGTPVTVTIDAGEQTPQGWRDLVLQPNARETLELAEATGDRPAVPLRTSGDGPFAVELRTQSPGENLRLWTASWIPAAVWEGPGVRPPVRRDEHLATAPAAAAEDPEGAPGP